MDIVEIYRSKRLLDVRPQWRWRYKAANHTVLANGGESYGNLGDLKEALKRVLHLAEPITITAGQQRIRRYSAWAEVLVVVVGR